jgi:hypothetical protein
MRVRRRLLCPTPVTKLPHLMKAERRHQLQTNTLAQGIGAFPLFWHKYGTKLMLGVVAVLAVVLFVKFQTKNAADRRAAAGEAYATALGSISSLRDPRLGPDQRREIQTQANAAIDQVLENTSDDVLKAEAMHARGELNWQLAMLAGGTDVSTTRPTTATSSLPSKAEQDKDELLDKARQAYEAAIQTSGAKPVTVTTARLGLANIAEQRQQWDAARAEYQKLLDDPNTAEPFKDQARLRMEDVKRLQTPPLLGKPATAPAPEVEVAEPQADVSGPAGPPAPATTRAASQPTTRPTTNQPAKSQAAEPGEVEA